MAIIKCKMCGGDIEISADKTFGTCEYCGSTMTLPKTDDDQRLSLFNRGTHLRRNGEFDKAAAIYERLIGENDADAEAHWNLVLCRYGIEYVQDPASGERIPTCHRASFDSILNDVDYQAALKYSDGVARSLYEKEAQRIAALQKDILAISQKETPFDVFICYKESDENGKRTKDSALAQDIYYQLTDAGYKVFFARITLEDKLGQEYEPYIFAALHSAKVMVVVGTKPEYLNAVWVKNEWSRYFALMRTDRSRLLIPCYRDMDPYDMPEELSMLQSQDMGKIGFIQDLIRGVKKVVDAGKPQETAKETVKETVVVHNEGGSNVQALLKRGNMALEDGEWSKADEFFEQVLNQDAECGAAYLGKFLAKVKSPSAQKYAASYIEQVKSAAPTRKNAEACAEDKSFIEACIQKYQVADYYPTEEIRKALQFDRRYCADRAEYFRNSQKRAEQLLDTDRNFARAEKYASGETKVQCGALRSALADALRQQEQTAAQEAQAEKQRVIDAYHAFLQKTEPRLAERQKAALAKKKADEQAAAQQRMEEERQRAEEERRRIRAQREAAAQKKKIIIFSGALVAVVAAILLVTKVIMPAANYSKAEKLLAAGDYDGAIAAFAALGGYKDSAEKLEQAETEKEEARLAAEAAEEEARNAQAYADAETMLENGEYDAAITAFSALGTYSDAADRLKDAKAKKQEIENARLAAEAAEEEARNAQAYADAEALEAADKAVEAAMAFGKLGDYRDARSRSLALWDTLAVRDTISAGTGYTVGLKRDGTVVAVGDNRAGECNVSGWTDIVAVSAGDNFTVGLKSDGTVVAVGDNEDGECDVSSWTDIVAVSAGDYHTVGLKVDGTVVSVGRNKYGECNVSRWTDIVAISAGDDCTVGVKTDGTVVAVGAGNKIQGLDRWTDIVSVSAGNFHTVRLKSDGTVVAKGSDIDGECDVGGWTDIVAASAGVGYTVGLKRDGTVVAVGDNRDGDCNVSGWTDIVAVSTGFWHTVGLKRDGTVVAVGNNEYGQCDVGDWTGIKLPSDR